MDELISREAAIDAIEQYDFVYPKYMERFVIELRDAIKADLKDDIEELPSAHPELDEWCTDCKEYDHERHCCPRYNRVIRESLAEIREAQSTEPKADERLVPKKPYTTFVPYFYKRDENIVQCPNCKRRLRTSRTVKNHDAYCPRCGQAIDWSEVEEE